MRPFSLILDTSFVSHFPLRTPPSCTPGPARTRARPLVSLASLSNTSKSAYTGCDACHCPSLLLRSRVARSPDQGMQRWSVSLCTTCWMQQNLQGMRNRRENVGALLPLSADVHCRRRFRCRWRIQRLVEENAHISSHVLQPRHKEMDVHVVPVFVIEFGHVLIARQHLPMY